MKRFIIMFLICPVLLPVSLLRSAEPDKVAEVASGELKEAKVSWWGFDPTDSTKYLQSALDSKVPRLIVDRQDGPWITGPLFLRNDMEIVFEEGVEVLAGEGLFQGKTDSLFSAANVKNLKLLGQGNGATLRMRKTDYHGSAYTKSEWRHGLALRSVENVVVENLSVVASGGDGIYLGVKTRKFPCKNVIIRKVICDDNNRQGISVISAEGLLIEDCVLKNTWGTPPAAGIDFEPNLPDEQITDCVMRRCTIENNQGDAIVFYLPNLATSEIPVSVRLERCVVKSSKSYGFRFITGDTPEATLHGNCELVDCRFENCLAGGIAINRKSVDGIRISMKNTTIVDCGKDETKTAPILFSLGEFDDFGGIDLGDVHLVDQPNRRPVKLSDMTAAPRQISGTIRLERSGATETITLNDAWIAREFPNTLRKIPLFAPDPKSFVPSATKLTQDRKLDLPALWLRKQGQIWVYGEKGSSLNFALGFRRVGKPELGPCSFMLTMPGGEMKKVVVPSDSLNSFEYNIPSLPETGVYRLDVDAGSHAFRVVRCNCPVTFPASPRIGMIGSSATLYFRVPDDSVEFGVRLRGEGHGEAVRGTIFDPSGREVWSEDNITEVVQFDRKNTDGKIGGLWKIVLAKPSRHAFEDNSATLLGIPPFLILDPNDARIFPKVNSP